MNDVLDRLLADLKEKDALFYVSAMVLLLWASRYILPLIKGDKK